MLVSGKTNKKEKKTTKYYQIITQKTFGKAATEDVFTGPNDGSTIRNTCSEPGSDLKGTSSADVAPSQPSFLKPADVNVFLESTWH